MGTRLPVLLAQAYGSDAESLLSPTLITYWENVIFSDLDTNIDRALLMSVDDKEGIGSEDIYDYSGNDIHATLNTSLTAARRVLVDGSRGISFNGTTEHMDFNSTGDTTTPGANDIAFTRTEDWTICFAISTTQTGTQASYGIPIVGRNNADVQAQIGLSDGFVQFNRLDTTWKENIRSHVKINDGKVHTVVFAYDSSDQTMDLFVDGEEQSLQDDDADFGNPGALYFMASSLMIGYNATYCSGTIYDFRTSTDTKTSTFATQYDGFIRSYGVSTTNGGGTASQTFNNSAITTSLLCGKLKDTSFSVYAEINDKRNDCQLVVSTNSDLSSPTQITSSVPYEQIEFEDEFTATSTEYTYVKYNVSGLTADTTYYYGLKSNGVQATGSDIATVKTAPAELTEPSSTSNMKIGLLTCSNLYGDFPGKAATFDGTTYLRIADNTSLSMGDIDFSMTVFVYVDDVDAVANQNIARKFDAGAAGREYGIYHDTSKKFCFAVSPDGIVNHTIAHTTTTVSKTWYMVTGVHDSVNDELKVKVNDEAWVTLSYSLGVWDGTADFMVGANKSAGVPTNFLTGKVAGVKIWKNRVLTSDEVDDLYKTGFLTRHADLRPTFLTNLESAWPLDEASGNRIDREGSNDLTPVGTVGQGDGPPTAKYMPVYTQMASETPLMVIHTGDFGYIEKWLLAAGGSVTAPFNDIQLHRSFLRHHIISSDFQTLARKCAIAIMLDDHEVLDDYHVNDSDIGDGIKNIRRAYNELIPHYDFASQDNESYTQGLQQEWYIGRTHYIMPDEKFQNSDDSFTDVTKLGDGNSITCDTTVDSSGSFTSWDQKQWLKDRLVAAKTAGAIKSRVIHSCGWGRDSVDGWIATAYETEAEELAQYMVDNAVAECEFLFGDSHRAEIDDGGILVQPLLENTSDGQFIAINSGAAHSSKYFDTRFSNWNETETTGHPQANASVYRWIDSGTTPNEYYIELAAGGDPKLPEPELVKQGTTNVNHTDQTKGVLGSLSEGEWAFGDQDTLGFDTVYYRASGNVDPDTLYMLFMYLRCYVTLDDEDDNGNLRVITDIRHRDSAGTLIRDNVYRTDDVTPTISVKETAVQVDGDVGTASITITKTWLGPWSVSYATTNRSAVAGAYGVLTDVAVGVSPRELKVNSITNKIYVANATGDSVSIIDGATNTVDSTVSVGDQPIAVAVNETTNKIYVGNKNDDTVSVINGATGLVTTTVSLAASTNIQGIAINETLNKIYVGGFNASTVTVIDGSTDTISTTTTSVGSVWGLIVNETTQKVYVSDINNSQIVIIDCHTDDISGAIPTGASTNPRALAIDETNNILFACDQITGLLFKINLENDSIMATYTASTPLDIDFDTDTKRLHVANSGSDTVLVLNTSDFSLVKTISVGSVPTGISVNSSTNRLYVTNKSDDDISVIDATDDYTETSGTLTGNPNSHEAVISIPITNRSISTARSFYLDISSPSTGTVLGSSRTVVSIDATESITSWDAIVDGVGALADEYATIDETVTSSIKSVIVKSGTYDEDITFDESGQKYLFDPATVIDDGVSSSGTITVSVAQVNLDFGANCTVDGLITWSGDDGGLNGRNAVNLASGLTVSGDRVCCVGGGLGSQLDDILTLSTVVDCIFKAFSIDTKTGVTGNHAISGNSGSSRNNFSFIKIIDSDNRAVSYTGSDSFFNGLTILGADLFGIVGGGNRQKIIGNYIKDVTSNGINLTSGGDNSVISGNIVQDQSAGADAVLIQAGSDNCIAAGNRVDDLGTGDGVTDSSGTATLGVNDETAF